VDILSALGLGTGPSREVASGTERFKEDDEASDSIDWLRCRFRLMWGDKSLCVAEGELAGEGKIVIGK
jgi:hypothetical protein